LKRHALIGLVGLVLPPCAALALGGGCGIDLLGTMPVADAATMPQDEGGGASLPEAGGFFVDGMAPNESGTDAALPPPSTVTIVSTAGAVVDPTGNAQQTHIVYAKHSGRWWLFTIDSLAASSISTWSSIDFVTWVQGASLTLPFPHGNEGGNFSVAYADLGGKDVVHLSLSLTESGSGNRHHDHGRAIITGAAIAFDAAFEIAAVDPSQNTDTTPDGCATLVTADGHVMELTGWAPYNNMPSNNGNVSSYLATDPDTGGTWAPSFPNRKDFAQADAINNRMGLATGGGNVLTIWESANAEPDPDNLRSSDWDGSNWNNQKDVFAAKTQAPNDWSAVRLQNGEIHALRRTTPGGTGNTMSNAFEHQLLNTGNWNSRTNPADMGGLSNGGVVVLTHANHMLVVTIGSDPAQSIITTTWDGTAWSTWATLEGDVGTRSHISGFANEDGEAAVIWSEGAAAGKTSVVGRRVIF